MKRWFSALAGIAVAVTMLSYSANKLTMVAVGASPIPSGCYTDSQGLVVCGPNYPGPGGGGVQGKIVAGVCTSPSPVPSPTGGVAVNYTCPTPGPQATPSPIAGSNITITGSWPYTIAASGGGGSVTAPSSYDNMIEGEPGLINYWPLSDASGAPVDASLGTILTAVGTTTYHTTSLCCNGDLSMTFPGAGNTNYFHSTGQFSYGAAPNAFWMEAWVEWATAPGAVTGIWDNEGGSGNNGMALVLLSTNHLTVVCSNVGNYDTGFAVASGVPYYIAMVWSGNYLYFFVNNSLVDQIAAPCDTVTSFNNFYMGTDTTHGGNSMIMQKMAFYSGTPPLGEITRHYNCGHSNSCKWAWNP